MEFFTYFYSYQFYKPDMIALLDAGYGKIESGHTLSVREVELYLYQQFVDKWRKKAGVSEYSVDFEHYKLVLVALNVIPNVFTDEDIVSDR